MARRAENPFDKAQDEFNRVAQARPKVGQAALISSLATVEREGTKLVVSHALGNINYAHAVTAAYDQVLSLDAAGVIEPPLSVDQLHTVATKLETLSIFTIENSGESQGPVDTTKIPTGSRKA